MNVEKQSIVVVVAVVVVAVTNASVVVVTLEKTSFVVVVVVLIVAKTPVVVVAVVWQWQTIQLLLLSLLLWHFWLLLTMLKFQMPFQTIRPDVNTWASCWPFDVLLYNGKVDRYFFYFKDFITWSNLHITCKYTMKRKHAHNCSLGH